MKVNHALSVVLISSIMLTLFSADYRLVSAAAPQISNISPATQTRSDRLRIFGSGFGTNGQVLIAGISAPVTTWGDTQIVAYVPEAAPLDQVTVQVVTAGGTSNAVDLQVTARQPNGRINWRFQHDGMYTEVRPAVGPDGTIYIVDVFSRLYALSPEGGLKWVVLGAGEKGVTVGADGTIYTGSEDAIKAFNPDGSNKWSFVQEPRAFILLGPNVGPDGNIYAVATSGIGVFSLTPEGQLRWTQAETYDRLIVDYQEVVFGPNGGADQLVFLANNHLRALRLDGNQVFAITASGNQPAIGPDGSIYTTYTRLAAYHPDGTVRWAFPVDSINNAAIAPDVGPDGVIYFAHNLSNLYAVNPNGTQRWLVSTGEIIDSAIVNPTNTQVGVGGRPTYGVSGFFEAFSTSSAQRLWRVDLADENGGQLVPDSRARFSSDGSTMYITAQILGGDSTNVYGYLYAIDVTSGGQPPSPTPTSPPPPSPTPTPQPSGCTSNCLRSTNIVLGTRLTNQVLVNGRVTVKNEANVAIPGATVFITWTLPNGVVQNQSVLTNSSGVASFSTSDGFGTYRLTVTSITKTGYTFDPANSLLSKIVKRK